MDVKISPSWLEKLSGEFVQPYFKELTDFVKIEYKNHKIYPPGKEVFKAFDHCAFDDVKVVIIGQDPYHGPNQANGLCFSVQDQVAVPPSLSNIFKEIKDDLNKDMPLTGNLERWALQGVLLLNATLTVRAGTPGSHQNRGWERFTDAVIKKISEEKKDIVFMLWGGYAQRKGAVINKARHLVLKSPHPSPLSAYRGFLGNRHFSKANTYLREKGKEEIDW